MAKVDYEHNTLAVSVSEAKTYLRITHSNDDTMIESLIRAAMSFVEGYCDAAFTADCDNDDTSDFFNDEDLASKWSTSGDVSETDHPGALVISSGDEDPADANGAYQRLTGNFDVRAHIKMPDGLGTSSGVLLRAKMDDDNAVDIRYLRNAAGACFLSRNDEDEGTTGSNTSAHGTETEIYLRLRRSGGRFFCYGKTYNTQAWTEVAAGATELLANGPVELWLSAYHGAGVIEAWFDWLVENSEYGDWPLPYCYEGSASGSGYRDWGECGKPICCLPMWVHPCTGMTVSVPEQIRAAILQMVRRLYDNRGGVAQEAVAGWAVTWLRLMATDICRLLDPFRTVGL